MELFKKSHKKIVISNCAIRSHGLVIRSHKLEIRSLELDNPFFRIAIRSLEVDNPFSRIAIRSLELDNSFSRIAIRSFELDNPLSRIAIRSLELDNPIRGNELHHWMPRPKKEHQTYQPSTHSSLCRSRQKMLPLVPTTQTNTCVYIYVM